MRTNIMTKRLQLGKWIGLYLLAASSIKLRYPVGPKRLKKYSVNAGKYAEKGLSTLNIEVTQKGFTPPSDQNFLIVGNHLSYLDILVFAAHRPAVFVTSLDMGEKFFIGTMAEMAGSIFIERRHRGQVDADRGAIARALSDGHDVMIYPEGTSTDGSTVLPFKKSLLMAAKDAGKDILPVMIKYTFVDGEAFHPSNHHKLCWYGEMSFLPHLLGVTELGQIKVELQYLDPIRVNQNTTRDDLALESHSKILTAYRELITKP